MAALVDWEARYTIVVSTLPMIAAVM